MKKLNLTPEPLSHEALFASVNPHTTILTPNRRLAATLQKLFQEYQLSHKQDIWHTADILPISTWIQRLWDMQAIASATPQPLLLSPTHEQFIWERIILAARESSQLIQISETADLAKAAWGLLKQWNISYRDPIFESAEDYLALQRWCETFESHCEKYHLIDNASLVDRVLKDITKNDIRIKNNLILIGFNEFAPQYVDLFEACLSQNITIKNHVIVSNNQSMQRINLHDDEAEIRTMAQWAHEIYIKNKQARVGCVIPNLEAKRDRVQQIFSEIFADKHSLSVDMEKSPFNISAGKPLNHYAIVHCALELLSLNKSFIELDTLSYLLATTYIGEAESERMNRAKFDSLLRQNNIKSMALNDTFKKSDNQKQLLLSNYCGKLAKRLEQFVNQLSECIENKTYREWAVCFNQLITSMGWPGERSLSSVEYQIVTSWLDLLNHYGSLDQISGPVDYQQALYALRKITAKSVFQPKTPEAPIQVLGVLEAAALPFEYLWVSGMDDVAWPPQPKPNPFIPKQIQRELRMPHATAERELIYCEQVTTLFKNSASIVIFSHADKNESLELQPSPLIRDLPSITTSALIKDTVDSVSQNIFKTRQLEKIIDEIAPPIAAETKVSGGTDIIKQQALCPFKAFATHRLHAREMEEPMPGLRPKDRGTIIHKVLEIIWTKLQSSSVLIKLNADELKQIIEESIEAALALTPNTRSHYKQYISLEKKRLYKLINDWLDLEKSRPGFSVMMREKRAEITLNKLKFSVQIDRIDQLEDGKKLIIDYKTGTQNFEHKWLGNRPDEPQLPLYALLDPIDTVGITFAQVAQGDNKFIGLSKYTLDINKITPIAEFKGTSLTSWDLQLQEWQKTMMQLSDDFSDGIAKVDPKEQEKTCEYCKLKPLCRIYEDKQI